MPDPPKKTVSAKLILKDIQAGIGESEIKRKFGLSDTGYQSVLRKLFEVGLLNKQELHSSTPEPGKEPDVSKSEGLITWRCPVCGTPQTRTFEECPQCGVIVAKASGTSLQGHPHPQAQQHDALDNGSGLSNRWAVVIVSIIAFLVIGGIVLKWSSHKATQPSISTAPAGSGGVHTFTTANFEREVKDASNTMPVLIMFYADW